MWFSVAFFGVVWCHCFGDDSPHLCSYYFSLVSAAEWPLGNSCSIRTRAVGIFETCGCNIKVSEESNTSGKILWLFSQNFTT